MVIARNPYEWNVFKETRTPNYTHQKNSKEILTNPYQDPYQAVVYNTFVISRFDDDKMTTRDQFP